MAAGTGKIQIGMKFQKSLDKKAEIRYNTIVVLLKTVGSVFGVSQSPTEVSTEFCCSACFRLKKAGFIICCGGE